MRRKSPIEHLRKRDSGRGIALCKALGLDCVWCVEGHRGGLCSWSRVSKEERGRRGGQGEGTGRDAGSCGSGGVGEGHLGFN